jgi:NADH-quinone oxidoreductase subunit G
MEFLLINHPLDCPICDQGGECDLQDQAMAFGMGGSRYHENKRAVEEKHIGPLIKTMMTRCIHCTRCVRYMTEVAGVEELGLIGRGEDAEITTYLEHGIMSEMSANAVDLCPVGALTHRPWAFAARPWEMEAVETIDVMDAVGSSISADVRGAAVMRILPRNNDAVNEEWISDKTRHVSDGLKTQRLDQPYIKKNGRFVRASWDEALGLVAEKLKAAPSDKIGAIAGDLSGAEEMFALKDLLTRFGAKSIDCRQAGDRLDPKLGRASYLFNSSIEGIEQADAILLVGANPRVEATVLNARIRKRWRSAPTKIGVIGPKVDLAYGYDYLGAGPDTLADIANGKHPFAEVLKAAAKPMVIVGEGAFARLDGLAVLSLAARILLAASAGKEASWNGFNVLHTAAARVAGLDLGFVPEKGGKDTAGILGPDTEFLYLLGADECDLSKLNPKAFVVYQGTHGDKGAERADVILPGAAYTEKNATYVNTEGRVQQTAKAVFPPGNAKEDWTILRALSQRAGATLPYDNIKELRGAMYRASPQLAALDTVETRAVSGLETLAKLTGQTSSEPFAPAVLDFYLTNPIARASAVMAGMSALKASKTQQLKAAE